MLAVMTQPKEENSVESPEDDLIERCRRLEEEVSEFDRRNAHRAERFRSAQVAGGAGVGSLILGAALTTWRHPHESTALLLVLAAAAAYLLPTLQYLDRAAIHTKVRDRCLSLRRDLRRFRELTVWEPESFPGAHERALALLEQDVADLRGAEREVP